MMLAQDAFKVGFLARCVEAQMTTEQIYDLVKSSNDLLEKVAFPGVDQALDLVSGIVKSVASYGIPLALAAPPVLGGAAGYGLARATDIDDRDIADVKENELKDEYKRQTEHLLRQKAMRDFQAGKHRPMRRLM